MSYFCRHDWSDWYYERLFSEFVILGLEAGFSLQLSTLSHRIRRKSRLATWCNLLLAKAYSRTTLLNLRGDEHKSSPGRQQSRDGAVCPRWWQYYPAVTVTSLWNPFLPHCSYTVIPYTPHTYICTSRALWQSAGYPPSVAVFAHYTHITSVDSCCYICIFQHERRWW